MRAIGGTDSIAVSCKSHARANAKILKMSGTQPFYPVKKFAQRFQLKIELIGRRLRPYVLFRQISFEGMALKGKYRLNLGL